MSVLLATSRRSAKVFGAEPVMASNFKTPPPPKRTWAGRLRVEVHEKIDAVVDLWQQRARSEGLDDDRIEAIDRPFVVDHLLSVILDEELGQWGGFPATKEAKAAQLKAVADATAQVALKKSR